MEDDFDCDSDEYEQAVAAVEEEMKNDMAGGQVETDGEAEGIITPLKIGKCSCLGHLGMTEASSSHG